MFREIQRLRDVEAAEVEAADVGPANDGVFPTRKAEGAEEPQKTPENGGVEEQSDGGGRRS
jgi:hypothetical protein